MIHFWLVILIAKLMKSVEHGLKVLVRMIWMVSGIGFLLLPLALFGYLKMVLRHGHERKKNKVSDHVFGLKMGV